MSRYWGFPSQYEQRLKARRRTYLSDKLENIRDILNLQCNKESGNAFKTETVILQEMAELFYLQTFSSQYFLRPARPWQTVSGK
jgi:hypothetical protein